MAEQAEYTKNYSECFDVEAYLNSSFKDPALDPPQVLKYLHKFWKRFDSQKNLHLLEFGAGPNISGLISACPYVEHIVFAEYTESIRKAAENWVKNTPDAFDWKATFDFIVRELEGGNQEDVDKRQAELRQKIQAFVSCDVKANNVLELPASVATKYHPPYDVVFTHYCLESVVESDEEYKEVVAKLAKLVKPGGLLVMHGALQESFYTVGNYKFYSYKLSKELIVESLEKAGVKDIKIEVALVGDRGPICNCDGDEFFVYGKRE